MSYLTSFELKYEVEKTSKLKYEVEKNSKLNNLLECKAMLDIKIEAELRKMKVWDDIYSGGACSSNLKWYDYEEDLVLLSSKFPGVLFVLEGDGEEKDDLWKEYFLEGQYQLAEARIVFDEFDRSKLEKGDIPSCYSEERC